MKKTQRMFTFFVVLFFLVYGTLLTGKTPHRVPPVTSKVKIDGILNEKAWEKALVMELKYEVRPGENIEPPVKTEVLLTYSKSYLYAAFRAYDPNPSSISAHIRERDNIGGDDWVAISIDTFNDQRLAFSFLCNPFGVQSDEIASPEGGGEAWDAIWNSAGRINNQGYVVEMAIPFSSLLFQRKGSNQDQVWGIDAVRSYPRSVRHLISLFPWDRNNNCYMCQAEKLVGFAGATPGKNIELDPTLYSIFTQERENFPGGDFIDKEKKVDPGLTGRWGFTPNLTLSATVNPDFSNVEADIPQLDINTRFAIYYPEKRPFFLEGASIFNTRFRAVHTRSLADPDWGLKVTGKEGKHAIGFFSVQDHITNLLIPGSQGSRSTSIDMNTLGSVLRYRLDVGKSSTLGILVTDREGEDYFNRMAAIDGDLRVTPKDRIRFQFLGSQTRYPEEISAGYQQPEETFTGTALDVYYHHDTRSFDWHLGYTDVSADFRADLGFMPQAGFRNFDAGLAHSWNRPRGYWFTVLNVGSSYMEEKDYHGNLLSRGVTFDFNYIGPLRSYFNLASHLGKRTYGGIEFDHNHVYFNGAVRPSGTFEFFFNGLMGDGIDFDNIQPGNRFQLGGTVRLRLGRHLDLMLDHKFERFNVDAGRLYTANISYLRLVYYFNRRTFLRSILKYVDYKYNTGLYSFTLDPRDKHLFSQFLFSYEINPRTVLFLGYSDDYYGYHTVALTQSNRTFFVKVGYALVL
ncbi:MAG: carbohydrate binding family 9 domain-containing protein [Candidatus Aminicenantes bacterium]|nr:MAG: carbohydrate binding family 9 domain-containing protein [Candidatus Aminicenantes bacterium]